MAWTEPKTWKPGEIVTHTEMNTYVRDNMEYLYDVWEQIAGYAYSSGQGNDSSTSDTQLTSYDTTIPANFLNEPGDLIVIDGRWVAGSVAGTRTGKIAIDGTFGSPGATCISTTDTSSALITFRTEIRRRTSTTGAITGFCWDSNGAYMQNASLSGVDWTSSQTLEFYAAFSVSSNPGEMKLADVSVRHQRGHGHTV